MSLRIVSVVLDAASMLLRVSRPAWRYPVRFVRLADLRSKAIGKVPVTTQFDGCIRTVSNVRLVLGEHCRFGRDVFLETCGRGRIRIGSHVRINSGATLVAYSSIRVGDECLIGEYVSIRDANHGMQTDQSMRSQPHQSMPIVIGNDVWIGRGSVILRGVTIGSGAVVGANSVVTRNVPPMTIVGGVPARVIRRRDEVDVNEAARVSDGKVVAEVNRR